MDASVFHHGPARLFAGLACGLSLVLALGAAAEPASAQALVTSYPGVLNSVSAASPTDAWAVGGNLILHWTGTAALGRHHLDAGCQSQSRTRLRDHLHSPQRPQRLVLFERMGRRQSLRKHR